MTRTRRAALVLLVAWLGLWSFVGVSISAQESAETKAADAAPQVPQDMKAKIADLQQQAAGYQRAIAVLQEKLDGVTMEYGRAIQALQNAQPGYELTPQLTYKVKPKSAEQQK